MVKKAQKGQIKDDSSWTEVASRADNTAVLKYLKSHNIHELSLSKVLWRCGGL